MYITVTNIYGQTMMHLPGAATTFAQSHYKWLHIMEATQLLKAIQGRTLFAVSLRQRPTVECCPDF